MSHHLGARVRLCCFLLAIGVLSLTGCVDGLEPVDSNSQLRTLALDAPPLPVAVAGLAELAQGIPMHGEAREGNAERAATLSWEEQISRCHR